MLRAKKIHQAYETPIATLRFNGYIVAIYIDDLLNVGLTFQKCVDNIMALIELLDSLGFTIYPDKSSFMPKQNNTFFIGFNINSKDMKISLINQKKADPTKQSKANHKVYSPDYRTYNIQPTKS